MSLTEYQRKRHFQRTPEPAAVRARSGGRSYVVQKHQASHLHYDFRLELDGVLKSWAVPKGPSLDPAVKRLAMHVEDHPVAYGAFEGIIPAGEYGGGTVMLWDRGTWEPIGDAGEGYRAGRLKFVLHGEKLRGGWMLVRTGDRKAGRDARQWLLFKERDAAARPVAQGDVLTEQPRSVATGRTLDEIKNDRDRVRKKKAKTTAAKQPPNQRSRSAAERQVAKVPLPADVEVQLAALAEGAPAGDGWLHEIKFDGYRMVCRIADGAAKFLSRNHQDWTKRLSNLTAAAARLPVEAALLDGEVVALRPDGTSDFQALQNAFRAGRAEGLYYYVFDVFHLNGRDFRPEPLDVRKAALAEMLGDVGQSTSIRLSEHVVGNGPAFFRQADKLGLEGIVAKRRDRPYRPGRNPDWLKVKCVRREEFVIGGYSAPAGQRTGFGALLVGQFNGQGKLAYAGKVGTGFDERTLQALATRLRALQQRVSPFHDLARAEATTHWVKPVLVAEVRFGERTRDGLLRHASFQGLREDKAAADVTPERAVPAPTAARKTARPARGRRASTPDVARPKRKPRKTDQADASTAGYDSRTEQLAGVRFTSPRKLLYPDEGITKLELANYYRAVADWMLPQLADRPLVLVRCPEGAAGACFYQKHPAVGTPEQLRRVPIREKDETADYVLVDDVPGLIGLAQIGALEVHAWGARTDQLELPDQLTFDLDPDTAVPWQRVVAGARQVRAFLQALGLESFLKMSGGKGLHLVVPIQRAHSWVEVKAFCKRVAEAIVVADPAHYTANLAKAARPGKIFIDYLRNGRGATAIAPYSPRARAGAPVAVPLAWKELTDTLGPAHYTIRNLPARLARLKRDPWEGMAALAQGLSEPARQLQTLLRA